MNTEQLGAGAAAALLVVLVVLLVRARRRASPHGAGFVFVIVLGWLRARQVLDDVDESDDTGDMS